MEPFFESLVHRIQHSNSFNKYRDNGCSEYSSSHKSGFSAGCQSVQGNIYDSCELIIEGHERYYLDNPDDPACTEFLHDVSNKQLLPPKSGSVCDHKPYRTGRPQIHNPERFCLVSNEPVSFFIPLMQLFVMAFTILLYDGSASSNYSNQYFMYH